MGASGRRRARLRNSEVPAESGTDLPEPVRCASAVPDRRQLRGHIWNCGNAGPVRRRRDPPPAGVAASVADRQADRLESPWGLRNEGVVEEWIARPRHPAAAPRIADAPPAPRPAAD